MTKSKKRTIVVIALLIPTIIVALFLLDLNMGSGSERYANKWAQRFADIESLEEVRNRYPESAHREFPGGDWIIGIASNSHFNPWGGTIVTKDSNGEIRCYFGHVCGDGFLKWAIFDSTQTSTLSDVYVVLSESFARYQPEIASQNP